MKVEVRKESGSRAVMEIEVPEDDVAKAIDQAYGSLVHQVRVPGFRPGKAPRQILERHLGSGALREEALRRLVPDRYAEAVAETGLTPIARPSIEIHEGADGKGLRLTATVDVYPTVTLPDYRAIRVERQGRPIGDDDVDRAIEDVRARHGRLASVADAARRGDFVLLTVSSVSPVAAAVAPVEEAPQAGREPQPPVESPTGANPSGGDQRLTPGRELLVEVGGGLLPEPVEASLEGSRAQEDRTAHVEGVGNVTVHITDVRRKELPPVDDAFARMISDQPTLTALREGIRDRLARERGAEEARALRERVLDAVLAQTTIDVPESLVGHEIGHMMDDLKSRLESRGLNLESYMRSAGRDEKAIREEFRPAAERRVRARLVLEAVAEREALTVGEEEMAAEEENLAKELHQDTAKVQAWLAEGDRRENLRESLLRQRAMTLLIDVTSFPGAAGTDPGSPAGSTVEHPGGAAASFEP
jgi:trigger factor